MRRIDINDWPITRPDARCNSSDQQPNGPLLMYFISKTVLNRSDITICMRLIHDV